MSTVSAVSYFPLAVALSRAEGARTVADVARKSIALKSSPSDVCCCSAYRFPHRPGSGDCPGSTGREFTTEKTLDQINAEELALFNRAEARAINSGSW